MADLVVAETHTNFSDLSRADVVHYIVDVVAQLDDERDQAKLVLSDCGFIDALDIEELAKLVGEEFGERTLVMTALEEIDENSLVADFVAALYPDLAP